jgi:hypothetical protein
VSEILSYLCILGPVVIRSKALSEKKWKKSHFHPGRFQGYFLWDRTAKYVPALAEFFRDCRPARLALSGAFARLAVNHSPISINDSFIAAAASRSNWTRQFGRHLAGHARMPKVRAALDCFGADGNFLTSSSCLSHWQSLLNARATPLNSLAIRRVVDWRYS